MENGLFSLSKHSLAMFPCRFMLRIYVSIAGGLSDADGRNIMYEAAQKRFICVIHGIGEVGSSVHRLQKLENDLLKQFTSEDLS